MHRDPVEHPQGGNRAGTVFIVEHVVPEHNVPHFSKLFDIHMMCWAPGGRDRSAIPIAVGASRVEANRPYYPENRQMGVVTGVRANCGGRVR